MGDLPRPDVSLSDRVLRQLGAAVLVVAPDGTVLLANDSALNTLGLEAAVVTGRALETVWAPLGTLEKAPARGEGDGRLRGQLRRTDGTVVHVGYSVAVLPPDSVRVITFRDISDLSQLQVERDRLLQMAAVTEALPTLLHEIKNPLAAIMATVELMLEDDDVPPRFRDSVHAVLQEARRIALQLEGVGGYSGRQLRSERATAVDEALRAIGLLLQGRAMASGVYLRVDVEEMPLLYLDAGMMRAVAFNLVNNAIQACRQGCTVMMHARLVENGRELELSVVDNGVGMTEEVLRRATDVFFTTKRHGSGLGLPLCKRAVESAGGTLGIESVPGAGTVVTARIPCGRG